MYCLVVFFLLPHLLSERSTGIELPILVVRICQLVKEHKLPTYGSDLKTTPDIFQFEEIVLDSASFPLFLSLSPEHIQSAA